MFLNERSPLPRAVLGVFEAALPLQYRPTLKIIFGKLAENCSEVYLPISQRPKTPGAVLPALITAVDTTASIGVELLFQS